MTKNPDEILSHAENLLRQGNNKEAKKNFHKYLSFYLPKHRNGVYCNLASIAMQESNVSLAIEHLKSSLETIPLWQARMTLGDIYLNRTGQYSLALEQFNLLIEENSHPSPSLPYIRAADTLMLRRRYWDLDFPALPYLMKAVELEPKNSFIMDRASFALFMAGRFEEAEKLQKRAIELEETPEFLFNLAEIYRKQKRLDLALDLFRKVIAARPDWVDAHVNYAHTLLHSGMYEEGWKEFEWRRKKAGLFRPFKQPHWDGYPIENIEEKTLMLYGEQGFGDTLQFVRYIPLLREKFPWCKVIFECNPPLKSLLSQYLGKGIDEIYGYNEAPIDAFSHHVSVMTLPLILGTTSVESIPFSGKYLEAPEDACSKWKEKLAGVEGLKVGLVWHGRPISPSDDDLATIGFRRNIPLRLFAPILETPNCVFYSLQKGDAKNEVNQVPFNIIDYSDELENWGDTAGLVANLDLVIGVDTAITPLAGSLGKEVWVLSRNDECWRWLTEAQFGNKSPWFSSLRLYRQKAWVERTAEIQQIAIDLKEMANGNI